MVQLSYDLYMPKGQLGQLADMVLKTVRTYAATEDIYFGAAVCAILSNDPDYARKCRLPRNNEVEIGFDGDLQPGNEVNLLVNGVPITTVAYAGSHIDTMNAIATQLRGFGVVNSATVGGANSRKIALVSKGDTEIKLSFASVTRGATRPNVVINNSSSDTILGVALLEHHHEQGYFDGKDACYRPTDAVSVLTQGTVYVWVEQDVGPRDPVYVRHIITGPGQRIGSFRRDDDENSCIDMPNSRWVENAAGNGIAALEINMP